MKFLGRPAGAPPRCATAVVLQRTRSAS